MKNEHIIWAYGDKEDGTGKVVILGITDQGIDFLQKEHKTLVVNPPRNFGNVNTIVVYWEKDKATLKEVLRKSGLVVSEAN